MLNSPFENGLKLMEAQQQLAARSLINLIEMISTTSHRYAAETSALTQEAMDLLNAAARPQDAASLAELQKKWAEACLKYSQNQSRAAMAFLEQCGLQAMTMAAQNAARDVERRAAESNQADGGATPKADKD
ncbi:MAG: phasin [Asticcacaulis sp.]|nr:phasin [Asticcacaulis sp.]